MEFDWQSLSDTVSRAVAAGKIGRPRALRVTLHVAGGASVQVRLRRAVIDSANQWFGGGRITEHGPGDEVSSPVSVRMLTWETGETALVSVSAGKDGFSGGDLTLLGSNGAVYHQFGGNGI